MRPAAILAAAGHRPWPLPAAPWCIEQHWHDLLFAHWPVPHDALRPLVPAPLELEECEGSAWLGVVPFVIRGLRVRGLPPVPGAARFPELNVRTYVRLDGRPGVYFFSLDAASRAAVRAARLLYHLPYHHAAMAVRAEDGQVRYRSRRLGKGPAAAFEAAYGPAGDVFHPSPGTLAHFLTERYCLYAARAGRVWRVEIHHPPWALQPAWAEIEANTMTDPLGLALPGTPPLLHFARRQDVVNWGPQRVWL